MRFGCCVSLLDDTVLRLPQAGADYAETGFSTLRDLSLARCRERSMLRRLLRAVLRVFAPLM